QKILDLNLPFDIVWLIKEGVGKDCFPKQIRFTDFNSNKAVYELSTAKVIVSNIRIGRQARAGWNKKPKQKYIQLWHGSLGIKRVETASKVFEKDSKVFASIYSFIQYDSARTDYAISNSAFESAVFRSDLLYKCHIFEYGHPRNDVFFYPPEKQKQIKEKVYQKLNLARDAKILLYAPTHRDYGGYNYGYFDAKKIQKAAEKKFGGKFIVLIRLHHNLKHRSNNFFDFSDFVIDASNYDDMQELLLSADIAITDYSSCIFDFMLCKKPAFIIANDIERYNNVRGFYYGFEYTPFLIAKNNDELVANIKNFDSVKYQKGVDEFLKSKGCFEDGKASERVVDLIKDIIANKA
ncbi:MAG: CDP-glycerol glycerophosphotransferase family protein, partial [Elusimicrobiota bacterium]|nr:CDP-glycerol glycerophosphotransferase family protein [Elusimicrobiota bacterium]